MNHQQKIEYRESVFGKLRLKQNQFNHVYRSYNDFTDIVYNFHMKHNTAESKELFSEVYKLEQLLNNSIEIDETA